MQYNQVGRSFIGDGGSTCNADGGWFSDVTSNKYFLGTVQGNECRMFLLLWLTALERSYEELTATNIGLDFQERQQHALLVQGHIIDPQAQ